MLHRRRRVEGNGRKKTGVRAYESRYLLVGIMGPTDKYGRRLYSSLPSADSGDIG